MCLFVHSLSIGPTTWIYTSEILPPKGVGLSTSVNWFMAYLLAILCNRFFSDHIGTAAVLIVYSGFTFCVLSYNTRIGFFVFDNSDEGNER